MKKICIIWVSSWIGQALEKYYRDAWHDVFWVSRVQYDLTKEDHIMQLAHKIQEDSYDLVIFSAGVWYHKAFDRLEPQEISEQISVNTLAPLQILRTISSSTKFVYLSSVMQYILAKNMAVYGGMKRATSQTLQTVRWENPQMKILNIDLWAVKSPMHLKAGMKEMVGKDIETVIPKLVRAIEKNTGTKTLFWDWWMMIYIVFPLYRTYRCIHWFFPFVWRERCPKGR